MPGLSLGDEDAKFGVGVESIKKESLRRHQARNKNKKGAFWGHWLDIRRG